MPTLPVGRAYGAGGTSAGLLELGFTLSHGRRAGLVSGDGRVPDPSGEESYNQVWTLEASLGLVDELSTRWSLPILHLRSDEDGDQTGLGDLSGLLRYGFGWGPGNAPVRLGLSAGAFLPTGGTLHTQLAANPGFASGTVDPQLGVDLSWDHPVGLGLYLRGFARLVAYDDKGYRAGHSLVGLAGLHARLARSLVAALGLTALHRRADRVPALDMDMGEEDEMSNRGGTWLYLNPSLSYAIASGPLSGLSLTASVQVPVYQFVHGTQLADRYNLMFGAAWSFRLFDPA